MIDNCRRSVAYSLPAITPVCHHARVTAPVISIPITAECGDFYDELTRIVIDAMRSVQLKLDTRSLKSQST
ncbi:hypothetical protein V7968_29105 [Nocardia vulneris]|uniref:hypothetical protein n=1 Tax=Nocardia vulneris TaxID=1141657 RepID=UPI0030CACFF9